MQLAKAGALIVVLENGQQNMLEHVVVVVVVEAWRLELTRRSP